MDEKFDAKLCSEFPNIFADRRKPPQETAMCWGFSCGDGWYDLIYTLCKVIQHHHKHGDVPQTVAIQVKEKWGGLRFYTEGGDEYIQGAITMAETMSFRTCEVCGDRGSPHSKGFWVRTLCPEHSEEQAQRDEKRRRRQEKQRALYVETYGDPEEKE